MPTYDIGEDGTGVFAQVRAHSLEGAVRHVQRMRIDWTAYGCSPRDGGTAWTRYTVSDPEGGAVDVLRHVQFPAPPCEGPRGGKRHSWREVCIQGHGGGVLCEDVCRTCGLRRITDTWNQDWATGQVLPFNVVAYDDAP